MFRTLMIGGAAALATLLTATACTTTLTVDANKVEDTIQANLGPQINGQVQEVDCPDDLKGEVGQQMECTMTVDGQPIKVKVTVTSVEGQNVNFDMETVA